MYQLAPSKVCKEGRYGICSVSQKQTNNPTAAKKPTENVSVGSIGILFAAVPCKGGGLLLLCAWLYV